MLFQGGRLVSTRGLMARKAPDSGDAVYQVCAPVQSTLPSACGHKKTLSSMLTYISGRIRCWPCRTGPYASPSYLPNPLTFCSSGLREFSPSAREPPRHSNIISQRLLEGRQQIKRHTLASHNQGSGHHNRRSARPCGCYCRCDSRCIPEREK